MTSRKKKAGTVPVRRGDDGAWRVLLLSSSADPLVYVLPKGAVEKGEKAKEAAVRETLEEAGVMGSLRGKVGEYNYETAGGKCVTQKMWLLEVGAAQQLDAANPLWKERARRERRWATFDEARAIVNGAPRLRPEIITMLDTAEKMLTTPDGANSNAANDPAEEDDE